MEFCKNRSTGKYFIYLTETGDEEALFVTPNAEIKNLKMELFTEPVKFDEAHLLGDHLVNNEQLQRFHEYNKNRSDEKSENLKDFFETLTPFEKDLFLKELQKIVDKDNKKDA